MLHQKVKNRADKIREAEKNLFRLITKVCKNANDHGSLRFGVKAFQTALRSVGSLWPIYG